jgi:RNA polymerase sigma factor (TIGR02999 family)
MSTQTSSTPDLNALLDGARRGDEQSLNRLFQLLYDDLRRVASARLRDGAPPTQLHTTALVHESYTRFARLAHLDVEDRAHFLAYASRVMRSVIVDAARARAAERRGGNAIHVEWTTRIAEDRIDVEAAEDPDVLRVNEALEELAQIEPRLAQVVEMRYFGGMSHAEIAAVLGIGMRTVERDWERARSFLYAMLTRADR